MEGNIEFQRAREDQENIRENMDRVSKNIASSEFDLMEVN